MQMILGWSGQVAEFGTRMSATRFARRMGRATALAAGVLVLVRVLGLG